MLSRAANYGKQEGYRGTGQLPPLKTRRPPITTADIARAQVRLL
jgi:hypothetical protein